MNPGTSSCKVCRPCWICMRACMALGLDSMDMVSGFCICKDKQDTSQIQTWQRPQSLRRWQSLSDALSSKSWLHIISCIPAGFLGNSVRAKQPNSQTVKMRRRRNFLIENKSHLLCKWSVRTETRAEGVKSRNSICIKKRVTEREAIKERKHSRTSCVFWNVKHHLWNHDGIFHNCDILKAKGLIEKKTTYKAAALLIFYVFWPE